YSLTLQPRNVRSEHNRLDVVALTQGNTGSRFIGDQPGERLPIFGLNEITQIVRRHFKIWIQDVDEQFFLATILDAHQIGTQGMALSASSMTRSTPGFVNFLSIRGMT